MAKTAVISCQSSHGGAGYAPNSYWDGDVIVCGVCGYRIENPFPTGTRNGQPMWPDWLLGRRGKPWQK